MKHLVSIALYCLLHFFSTYDWYKQNMNHFSLHFASKKINVKEAVKRKYGNKFNYIRTVQII